MKREIWKDNKHSHFWIEDGELFESYWTIRGLRYRHRMTVTGLEDTDNCSLEIINKIEEEYLPNHIKNTTLNGNT